MSEEHGSRQIDRKLKIVSLLDTDSRKSKLCMWWDHGILKFPVTLSSLKSLLTQDFYIHSKATNWELSVQISDWGTFFIQTMTVTKATWSSAGTADTCPCCPTNWTVWSSDSVLPLNSLSALPNSVLLSYWFKLERDVLAFYPFYLPHGFLFQVEPLCNDQS